MKPDGMIRCYYDFDLGPFGPMVLNLAKLAQAGQKQRFPFRRAPPGRGFPRHFDLQPNLRAGGRM
jgi:hypothetical protein